MFEVLSHQISAFQEKVSGAICVPCLLKAAERGLDISKDVGIELGDKFFADTIGAVNFGHALTVTDAATKVAEITAGVQDMLNKMSKPNRDKLDMLITGICGSPVTGASCTSSQLDEIADDASNLPFMAVTSWSDITKVASGSNADFQKAIRTVVEVRATQLGYAIK